MLFFLHLVIVEGLSVFVLLFRTGLSMLSYAELLAFGYGEGRFLSVTGENKLFNILLQTVIDTD